MSDQRLEAVRGLFAAYDDRDLDAAARVLDPSVEIRPAIVGGPEGVVYRGLDGMRRFWADIDAAWAEFRLVPEEYRVLADGRVLVLGRAFARGRDSGVVLDSGVGWLVGLREAGITSFQSFSNQRDALEAAGLVEDG